MQQEEKLAWSDPWLQSIDLEYHSVDLEQGLFYDLERSGMMRRIVSDDEISAAMTSPPETTRAFFRGRAVAKYAAAIAAVQWDEVVLKVDGRSKRVALPEATLDARLGRLHEAIAAHASASAFLRAAADDL
jgi:proteasome accessory factor A